MGAAVLIQTYAPVAELGGFDGLGPCPQDLARRLIDERRAEMVDGQAEALRYVPGSPAWRAMRASRGQDDDAGAVLVLESQGQQTHRGRGRPRKQPQAAQ